MSRIVYISAILLFYASHLLGQAGISRLQKEAINYIEKNKQQFIALSDSIWNYAEPSFHETRSVAVIMDVLEREGFSIKRYPGYSTVFVASYGTGKPVIGLYGEYDADAGASNKSVPYKETLVQDGYGHGGAHNLLGAGSVAAALAVKNLIARKKLSGTVRFYGTTAEGTIGTRSWLAKDGFFDDLDISLYWHPAPVTAAPTRTWDALIDFQVNIRSKSLDLILTDRSRANCQTTAEKLITLVASLKDSANETSKLNYSIHSWKNDLRHSPDSVVLNFRIQCAGQPDAIGLFNEIRKLVNSFNDSTVQAALKVTRAHHQFLPNITAMATVHKNMTLLAPIRYNKEEVDYSKRMQDFLKSTPDTIKELLVPFTGAQKAKKMYGYSSDIGEASWFAPEICFIVKCFPAGIRMHQWSGTAFTAHSIGHKGMIKAAKILAMTIVEYHEKPALRRLISGEFEANKGSYRYQPLIE